MKKSIIFFKIFKEFLEGIFLEVFRINRISLISYKIDKLFCFWTIRYHDKRKSVDTREDSCMQSHTYNSIESRIDFEGLLDGICCIICTPCHDPINIEGIILRFVSLSRMYEKYRIISFFDKIIIDFWNLIFVITEKSSSHRNTDTFFLWHFWNFFWNKKECNIMNLGTRNFQSIQKSSTFFISNDDKVSFLKKFSKHHFIFYLLYFE